MLSMLQALTDAHGAFFRVLERIGSSWLLGLAMRLVFCSVTLVYFLQSGMTKLGDGLLGFLHPSDGAYAQVLPGIMEQVGYDVSQIPFFPLGLIVLAGTWAEFLLPLMILVGLFTRMASLGMIVFICVMTYVDIYGHGVDAATIGSFFDSNPSSLLADQRLLWGAVLLVLVLKGPGALSIDRLLERWIVRRSDWSY